MKKKRKKKINFILQMKIIIFTDVIINFYILYELAKLYFETLRKILLKFKTILPGF
jgi:hypothetical protein